MKSKIRTMLIPIPILFLLITTGIGKAPVTVYCNRQYTELLQNPGQPYNAVGFLNNGCTAFLIDSNHIVAAAHCFVDGNGQWQRGLRFYPNFHPDRVVADERHVPRGDVTRAVVGSRTGENELGIGVDWGIARIENWRDTSGLDLTPLALAQSMPVTSTALVNPAYTRHHFPYNDNDSVTWDNMEWDTTHCDWVDPNHGMWATLMRPAPIYDGVNRDIVGCNSRWGAGMIHANCFLRRVSGDVVIHDCDTVGGSSGSPIVYRDSTGQWSVIGVGHGGGPTTFNQLVPLCTNDTPDRHDNVGPSVERFRDAPRYASNVAVHRRPDNASATAVFAVDSDTNQVVYRSRAGTPVTYTSKFSFWKSLGSPYPGARLTRIATCSADASGKPQVFVVADEAQIYTRSVLPDGNWGPWSNFGIPGPVSSAGDIDVAYDAGGNCLLFMVAKQGDAFARMKSSDTAWSDWTLLARGSYKAITALKYNGKVSVALLDTSGEIWKTTYAQMGFNPPNPPTKLRLPGGVSGWLDIDMTWDEAERGFMLAIPNGGGNRLWFTPMYGSQPLSEWRFFDTQLWAPRSGPQNAPSMVSITASRWMEDPPGTTSPVVFATDDSGNIYFVEYSRVGPPGWILDWKSFYHEFIP